MSSRRETVEYIINPLTDRKIKVHSRTYYNLVKKGIINGYYDEPEQESEEEVLNDTFPAIDEDESEEEEQDNESEEEEQELLSDEESDEYDDEEPKEEEQDIGGAGDNTPAYNKIVDDLTDDDVNKLYDYVNLLRNKNKYKY